MSALDTYSPSAVIIVKLFAYPFRAAPTADLVAVGVAELGAGGSPAQILDYLFNLGVPQSPFVDYAQTADDAAFATALVANATFGTTISSATQAAWVAELTSMVSAYPTRGAFGVSISTSVENYVGTDVDVLALQQAWAVRVESAASFAQSAAGAEYDGQGWGQLTAPLAPPPPPPPEPTYALSSSVATVDEGQSVTFMLHTTDIAAGTLIAYTLAGTGITTGDVVGGLLEGSFSVGSNGVASASASLVNDSRTEGSESLRLALADGHAEATVSVRDTSLAPPPVPAYVLGVDATSRNEGGSFVFSLTTANLSAGTVVPFTLSGTGITTTDMSGGSLIGSFTTDAAGKAIATVGLEADATTEGNEVMRLTLGGEVGLIAVTIEDTSVTPQPGGPDVLMIREDMSNSQSSVPQSAFEGELGIESVLTYDFLRQTSTSATRLSLSDLRSLGDAAGAPLILTNRSADRGSIPQVSNQHQFTFDLGEGIDRADYSAESGSILLVAFAEGTSNTLSVLVNDNSNDSNYDDATDRIDTLKNVEEVVASAGGGVIDLSASGQGWLLSFSRSTVIDTSLDRELRRVELDALVSPHSSGLVLLDSRDAGLDGSVPSPTAVWTEIQGGDGDEELVFTDAESLDQRSNNLRGGTNSVRFDELELSVLTDVAITPWAAISNRADDTNITGTVVATTVFSTGNGTTLRGPSSNVTSSYAPDNRIAAGVLKIAGSIDEEDSLSFAAGARGLEIVLGEQIDSIDVVLARLAGEVDAQALQATGYEALMDNGNLDDVYVIGHIARAIQRGPKLADSATDDHDLVRISDEAVGTAPVGGSASGVNLATLNGASAGLDFDFDVLDLSKVTRGGLNVSGTAGSDDELVAGPLGSMSSISLFEALVLTDASIDKGHSLVLDLDTGAVKVGSTILFRYDQQTLSASGLVYGKAGQDSAVPALATALDLTVIDTSAGTGATVWGGAGADTIAGGAGDDIIRGAAGDDTLDGGLTAEFWQFELAGSPDFATPANRITVTLTIDGEVLTLSEAPVADTDYADGAGAVVDGAGRSVIGAALAALVNANLTNINDGPGSGSVTRASWVSSTSILELSFETGVDADDLVTLVVAPNGDSGTFAVSAGLNQIGGSSGDDRFILEASGTLNGSDTFINFVGGSDKIDATAFAGVDITGSRPAIDAEVGGTLTGQSSKVELIFNKGNGLLSSSDFTTGVVSQKFGMPDGTRCVVAVTSDLTGVGGDGDNNPVALYFVVNGPAIGLSDLTVSLVGLVSGPNELTLEEVTEALD
jgi:hypothetical protein